MCIYIYGLHRLVLLLFNRCRYPQPLVDRVCFQSSFVFFLLHWICIPPSSSSCLSLHSP
ncbi:hypothetical protein MtrunA17_Chr3g0143081 [Medicago truncatula]|uniref:Uncharacterized protein n=1 Tax=Medicago truncatula TaxID=3880 RepID=A0A396IZF5_MEDTR|nr:hypothetical protein MtrunA17_Chr3g0143081 [Medicago truncatula]